MKKIYILSLLFAVALLLTSCTLNVEPQLDETTAQSVVETTVISMPPFPSIAPETIIVFEDPHDALYIHDPHMEIVYRAIYYSISESIYRLGEFDGSISTDEMALLFWVRHHNISREDFMVAVQLDYEGIIARGWDVHSEGAELPCPDIIFTFDNEIINAFYRRENPVSPEWWPLGEADNVRVFESYSAFRAANPH